MTEYHPHFWCQVISKLDETEYHVLVKTPSASGGERELADNALICFFFNKHCNLLKPVHDLLMTMIIYVFMVNMNCLS